VSEANGVETSGSRLAVTSWRAYIARHLPGLTRRLGGAKGPHGGRDSSAWAYLLAAASFAICMLRQVPCRLTPGGQNPDSFAWMCYTDITALFYSRGQATGAVPYVSMTWEYPVLTGYFAAFANGVAQFFGAVLSAGADGPQQVANGNLYFAVNAVLLFGCLIWLIASVSKLAPDTPGIAMAVAISPAIMTTALINWDLLVVALTAAGMVAWKRERFVWAGVWWGLGVAAKLYPIVIVGALFILTIRPEARRTLAVARAWLTVVAAACLAWLAVNLPVMVAYPEGWSYFYTYNYGSRPADLGSAWYALSLSGIPVPSASTWSKVVMLVGYAALAVLIYRAPRPPRIEQIAYLAVAVMLVGNLVYSPQYVLWALPLIVLARPHALDYWVFTASELVYFVFIWLYLRGNDLTLGSGKPAVYVLSIVVRLAATGWLMSRVVRDILPPAPDRLVEPTVAG